MSQKKLLLLLLISCFSLKAFGQDCPMNIGFEAGTFLNWECFSGKINTDGSLSLLSSPPDPDRHVLIRNTYPQAIDPYGNFPVNCPNGSNYSIRLGNSSTGSGAERVTYTFTIPANQNDYGIIYNYAVVFQNPDHEDYQQPRFTSRVFDVTSGNYLPCGAFEFVASAGLPGFEQSSAGTNIFYKNWSPITVKLFGLAGRTIRLEFTNNDCSRGGHFGYAYLDVNENCSSPITGNTYCGGTNSVTLTAPFGFAGYHWFTSDFTVALGTSNTLTISPPPPPNTSYVLIIEPYPGLGCLDTLRTTIHLSPDAFVLSVKDTVVTCEGTAVDLTLPGLTTGSSPGLVYSYFTDPLGQHYVPTPQHVLASGDYYIKAVNSAGCTETKLVYVNFKLAPNVVVNTPPPVCKPAQINLTAAAITAGSEAGLVFSYWSDAAATIPLPNPASVDITGTYYIKSSIATGCSTILPVTAIIGSSPDFTIHDPAGCGTVDLGTGSVLSGNPAGLSYGYWLNQAGTDTLQPVSNITASGTYYIRATSVYGCTSIKPVQVTIYPLPVFTVTNPAVVTYPATIDITSSVNAASNLVYSYWKDILATRPLTGPRIVDSSGTWYIKATSAQGCTTIMPVKVLIKPPPDPVVTIPNVFSPNNDGVNDLLNIKIIGEVGLTRFGIYTRYGQLIFETQDINKYWNGRYKSSELPAGTYYWIFQGYNKYNHDPVISSGSVTLLK